MDQRRHTLLIVDDEPDVVESLRYLFYRRYQVLTATSATAALEQLRNAPGDVHVILTDQRMPGITGEEFLVRAREIAPNAVRLLFTGYADIQSVINAINRVGIFRYILKPWDPIELETIIRQAAEQYDLLAERRSLIDDLKNTNARLKQANRELADSDQLKTAFLEVASHELKTPITIIQGYSQLLNLTCDRLSAEDRQNLQLVIGETAKLTQLVNRMLKLIDSGDFHERLHLEPTDLELLVRESVEKVAPFIQSRSLQIRVEIPEPLGVFEIDRDKIRDVLLNLLSNAIKFTHDSGQIVVSARLDGPDWAEIEVVDRGIGMESRSLNRLFSPFFTEFEPDHHSSGSFEFGKRGLGLGLFLVKTFLELHGGTASARSTLGEGTVITIRLPRRPCHTPIENVQ